MHLVFHISMLNKCLDLSFIVPLEIVRVKDNLSFEEILFLILNQQTHKLRNKEITSIKILWLNQLVEEAKWEPKEI